MRLSSEGWFALDVPKRCAAALVGMLALGCGSTPDDTPAAVTPAAADRDELPRSDRELPPAPSGAFRVVIDAEGLHVDGHLVVPAAGPAPPWASFAPLVAVVPDVCREAVISASAHTPYGMFVSAASTLTRSGVDRIFVEAAHVTAHGSTVGAIPFDVPRRGPDNYPVEKPDIVVSLSRRGISFETWTSPKSPPVSLSEVAQAARRFTPREPVGVAAVLSTVAVDVQTLVSVTDALSPTFTRLYYGYGGRDP